MMLTEAILYFEQFDWQQSNISGMFYSLKVKSLREHCATSHFPDEYVPLTADTLKLSLFDPEKHHKILKL